MTQQELLEEITMLPTEQRMLFAEYLLASLKPTDADIQASWKDEVQRRMDVVGNGNSEVMPSEEFHNGLYRIIESAQ